MSYSSVYQTDVPLTLPGGVEKLRVMLRYSSLVGKRVRAHYRAGDIHFSAVGTLVSDSGKSIFVEEHFSQSGKDKTMRIEIPYAYLISIGEECSEQSTPVFSKPFSSKKF